MLQKLLKRNERKEMIKLTVSETLVLERIKLVGDSKLPEEKDNVFIQDLGDRTDTVFNPDYYKKLEFTFVSDSGIYSINQLIKGLAEDFDNTSFSLEKLDIIEEVFSAIASLYMFKALPDATNLSVLDPVKIFNVLLGERISDSGLKSLLRGHVEKLCATLDELRKFINIFMDPDINSMIAPIFCYNVDYLFGRKILVKFIYHKER